MLLALSLTVVVFVFDLLMPPGISAGMTHVLPILVSRRCRKPSGIIVVATVASLCVLAAFYESFDSGEDEVGQTLANCSLTLFVIWAAATSVHARREAMDTLTDLRLVLDAELDHARQLQKRLYPQESPPIAGLDIAGAVYPAERLCGDYFDYIQLPDGTWAFAIGDVSGHGAGASLVMSEVRSTLRMLTETETDVGRILTLLNSKLVADTPPHMFVTLMLVGFNDDLNAFTFAAAGHNAFLFRASGACEDLRSGQIALGLDGAAVYETSQSESIGVGEVLLLITDGIAERISPTGELFGYDRLQQTVRNHWDRPAEEIIQSLRDSASEFANGRRQDDDMTFIVIKRTATMVEERIVYSHAEGK